MEEVFHAPIDRSRVLLDLKTVRTILGGKHRPKYRSHKKRAAEWKNLAETAITAKERANDLIIAEHYNVSAEAAERSVKATLEERFARMRTA